MARQSIKRAVFRFPWPSKGVIEAVGYSAQPDGTTVAAMNVRNREGVGDRYRGGQRPGLCKYMGSQINGDADIQCLAHVVTASAYSGAATISARAITSIAVAGGDVVKFDSAGTYAVTGGEAALSATAPVIFAVPHFGTLYFADGASAVKYTVASNTAAAWAPTAGTFPHNGTAYPRLIAMWRGRIVLSGISADAHNWFMSAVNDPLDFDFGALPVTSTRAVAGNTSPAGKLDDIITGLCPYSDDAMIFFGDHSTYQLSGDPMAGGVFDKIADVGCAFGEAWCRDTSGGIFFFGTDREIYRLVVGQGVQNITGGRLERVLSAFDMGDVLIRMAWSQDEQGLYVYITPVNDAIETVNLFWDAMFDAWWTDKFGNFDHYPRAVHVFDGDDPDDRTILLGGKDGYIRRVSRLSLNDDGTAIDSYVMLGPITSSDPTEPYILDSFQGVLGVGSSDVGVSFHAGPTAEAALADSTGSEYALSKLLGILTMEGGHFLIPGSQARIVTDWVLKSTRSRTTYARRRAHVGYLQLRNDGLGETWAFEWLQVYLDRITGDRRVHW